MLYLAAVHANWQYTLACNSAKMKSYVRKHTQMSSPKQVPHIEMF